MGAAAVQHPPQMLLVQPSQIAGAKGMREVKGLEGLVHPGKSGVARDLIQSLRVGRIVGRMEMANGNACERSPRHQLLYPAPLPQQ